mmetsp:Transcript_55597/g.176529  ORF Transcript_55597/g.176529 Transcript_55597/m.176529 type:complete len:247 (-) Transcript_55597:238-978(-)
MGPRPVGDHLAVDAEVPVAPKVPLVDLLLVLLFYQPRARRIVGRLLSDVLGVGDTVIAVAAAAAPREAVGVGDVRVAAIVVEHGLLEGVEAGLEGRVLGSQDFHLGHLRRSSSRGSIVLSEGCLVEAKHHCVILHHGDKKLVVTHGCEPLGALCEVSGRRRATRSHFRPDVVDHLQAVIELEPGTLADLLEIERVLGGHVPEACVDALAPGAAEEALVLLARAVVLPVVPHLLFLAPLLIAVGAHR